MSALFVIMMLFILFCIVAPIAAWFYAMVSICDHSANEFEVVGQSKWVWLGLNLMLGPLASVGYIIWARPPLKRLRQTGVNLNPITSVSQPREIYPYPTDDRLGGAYNKSVSGNEYFPEFDRDVA